MQRHLKEEEVTKLVQKFILADKDNDGKISIKQLCKIMGQDFKDITQNQAQESSDKYSLITLVGTIKIDFLTFLEFYEKHELSNTWKEFLLETSVDEDDESIRRLV